MPASASVLYDHGEALVVSRPKESSGIEEPETYEAQPLIFDYPHPNWVPPTHRPTDRRHRPDEYNGRTMNYDTL